MALEGEVKDLNDPMGKRRGKKIPKECTPQFLLEYIEVSFHGIHGE